MVASAELLDCYIESLGTVASAFEAGDPEPDDTFPKRFEALQHLLVFFSALEECLVENVKNHELHFARHSVVAFPIVERLQAVLKTLDADEVEDLDRMQFSLEHMARTFWVGLPASERPERKFPRFTQQLMSAFTDMDSIFFTTLEHWTQLDACAGPSCLRSGEDFPEPLKLCQRCRVLRYCSRECQKEHWAWKKAPHKASCQLVGQFGALVKPILKLEEHGGEKCDLFVRAVDTAGHSWDDVKVAFDALEALTFKKEELRPRLVEYKRPNKEFVQ
ncbi:hypothetical protein AURDEDRAFT_111374 [Auricularia subglabra TFB-10046 SS5]|nr:hypothetical protein AURDEDRAFT_111374 [Auricularia subglabra TFB-10046 SS5]